MIPREVQDLLSGLHSNGALLGHQLRQPEGLLQRHLPRLENPRDQPNPQRLVGVELSRRETDLLDPAHRQVSFRQAGQSPDISREPDIDFLDRKAHIPRAEAHITTSRNVQRNTIRNPMQNRNNGFLTLLNSGNTSLELQDVATQGDGFPRSVQFRAAGFFR